MLNQRAGYILCQLDQLKELPAQWMITWNNKNKALLRDDKINFDIDLWEALEKGNSL